MKKLNFFLPILFMGFYGCLQSLPALAADAKALVPVIITSATVYVPLGQSRSTQAFFTIKNNSASALAVTKVISPSVEKIELIPSVSAASNPWIIAAGQILELRPGKQYLQLDGLKNSLTTGDELQLEVSLSNGKTLYVVAQAKSAFDQIHGH